MTRDEVRATAIIECLALDYAEFNDTLAKAAEAMQQLLNAIATIER
jgi:hypothetical protein